LRSKIDNLNGARVKAGDFDAGGLNRGFNRDSIQGYLILSAFVRNPPVELRGKEDLMINLAYQNLKVLYYRYFYSRNT
jgi:hypothetical protein